MIKKFVYKFIIAVLIIAIETTTIALAAPTTETDQNFINFIAQFRQTAIENNIDISTYNRAFHGIALPYTDMLKYIRTQPEFHNTPEQYLKTRITEAKIQKGKSEKQDLASTLQQIEDRFGVDKSIVLAIWANETDYGAVLQNKKIMKDAVRALATLAYYKSHYNNYAQKQLIALLKILQRGYITRENLQSSWAGAMGHTQFIPSSYLLYAVDMDKDGKSDIVNSVPDALATTANLLAKHGWKRQAPWLYEITADNLEQIKALKDYKQNLTQWAKLGIKLKNNKPLPQGQELATLTILGTQPTRYFLTMHNFDVIKAYNNSNLYALAVALLANNINT